MPSAIEAYSFLHDAQHRIGVRHHGDDDLRILNRIPRALCNLDLAGSKTGGAFGRPIPRRGIQAAASSATGHRRAHDTQSQDRNFHAHVYMDVNASARTQPGTIPHSE